MGTQGAPPAGSDPKAGAPAVPATAAGALAWQDFATRYSILIAFFVVCFVLAVLTPNFLTSVNIINVLRQVSITGVIAVGMTFVILIAGIDLSVGSVLALAGMLAAGLQVRHGAGVAAAVLVPLAVSTALGLLVGVVITKLKINAFVTTLGLMSIARGLTLVYSNGYPISGLQPSFRFIGNGFIGPIPVPVIIYGLAVVVGALVLSQTRFGRYIYAIGGNEEAARLSGIPVDRYKILVFGISGFAAGLGGLMLTARLNSANPVAGTGYELDVIASVVIGGTSLFGGRGGVVGTLFGSLLMGVIGNGLNLLNVSSFYQQVVKGAIIIVALILDRYRQH